MDHLTSAWASEFGLPDPGVPADEVLAAHPRDLRRLADRGRSVATALRNGADRTRRATGVLIEGWSTPDPRRAARWLFQSADRAADVCEANAAAIDACATALAAARSAVERAYGDADATIAAGGLAGDWAPLFGSVDVDRARAQVRVVTALSARLERVAADARRAAGQLCASMGPDPRPQTVLAGGTAGGTAGAPAAADPSARTDSHNRALLVADLHSASPTRRAFAAAVQQALRHGTATAGAPVQLLAYDPEHPPGQGGAAIAVGDVSTADSVAVLVPGVNTSPSQMSGPLDSAAALSRATVEAAPGTTTATVLWMGYDIPLSFLHDVHPVAGPIGWPATDLVTAADAGEASAGGALLARFCLQLRQDMDATAGLTLVGHSYGSIVVSQAALRLRRGDGVDDIVLLASPGVGLGVRSADGYPAVPADHVYAIALPGDPIPMPVTDVAAGLINPVGATLGSIAGGGGPFGRDPVSGGFGAQVIAAPGRTVSPSATAVTVQNSPGRGPLRQIIPPPTIPEFGQHAMDNYLGGAALAAVGAVVAGKYATVPVRPHR